MRHISIMTNSCRLILLLSLAVLVTNCSTMTPEQLAARNEERCTARGYQPKTDAFADCIVRLETERDTRLQSVHREAAERNGIPSSNRGY